jgi:hypothetical protein
MKKNFRLSLLAALYFLFAIAPSFAGFTPTASSVGAQSDLKTYTVSATSFGAFGDCKTVYDGSISSGTSTFTSASAAFTGARSGEYISISGAGVAGATLVSTITAVNSATSVTIATPASTTVSSRTVTDGVITAGSTTITSATAAFTGADVGKYMPIAGADVSGIQFITTIKTVTNSTTIVVNHSPSVSASGVTLTIGARSDVGHDDTTAIQAAINIAGAIGGRVYLPQGGYLVSGLTVPSSVTIVGANNNACTLIMRSNANTDVIQSTGFATLTGTDVQSGPNHICLTDFTIDGNKGANTSGCGIKFFGFDNKFTRLNIRNCAGDALYSEYGKSGTAGGTGYKPDGVECITSDCKMYANGGCGVHWLGPDDSLFSNVISAINTGTAGFYVDQSATATGGASLFVQCHAWGAVEPIGFQADSEMNCINCIADTNGTTGVLLRRGTRFNWIGGSLYNFGAGVAAWTGLQIGDGTYSCQGAFVETTIDQPTTAGVNFVNSGGRNMIRASVLQPKTGITVIQGSVNGTDSVDITTTGMVGTGANQLNSLHQGLGPWVMDLGATSTALKITLNATTFLTADGTAAKNKLNLNNGASINLYTGFASGLQMTLDALTGHIVSSGTSPTFANGSQTTATAVGRGATDLAGQITTTTTASPAVGDLFTMTFATAYGSAPKTVIFFPANAAAAACVPYTNSAQTFGASTRCSASVVPAASTVLLFNYIIIQ